MNAATCKEIFPFFKNNQVWFGNTSPKVFLTPDRTEKKSGNIVWYTNLDNEKRHCRIPLKENIMGMRRHILNMIAMMLLKCLK